MSGPPRNEGRAVVRTERPKLEVDSGKVAAASPQSNPPSTGGVLASVDITKLKDVTSLAGRMGRNEALLYKNPNRDQLSFD